MYEIVKKMAIILVYSSALALVGCGGSSSSSSGTSGTGGSGTAGATSSYTIGGTVSGLPSGQTVTLADNGGDALNITASGPFTFSTSLATGATYSVTVQSSTSGTTCSVSNGSGTVASVTVTSVLVTCAAASPPTYTVGGTVSGLASGATATLLDNGSDALPVSSNGTFTFSTALSSGTAYAVTVGTQPTGQSCAVTAGSGTVGASNVTTVAVSCTAVTYHETVLHSFGNSDGSNPLGALIMDRAGNLYGATLNGGPNGEGTVFEFSPPSAPSGTWTESILYSFPALTDGSNPTGGLVMDGAGNLYGMTEFGGDLGCTTAQTGCGVVYELSPPASAGTAWTETVLYAFTGGNDGKFPPGSLIMDSVGNLYGSTAQGGANGGGTVFELVRPGSSGSSWTLNVLHAFGGSGDGVKPLTLIMDGGGNLYGMTELGGDISCSGSGGQGCGIVFELSPTATAGLWTESILHTFGISSTDGQEPVSTLILAPGGNLYGTTTSGGGVNQFGTLFELSPPSVSGGSWTDTLLYAFAGGNDGAFPGSNLIMDSAGDLFGTTGLGGLANGGTVFEASPPASAGGAWTESVLHSFLNDSTDGDGPGGLVADKAGNFYGVTQLGGAYSAGILYEISP